MELSELQCGERSERGAGSVGGRLQTTLWFAWIGGEEVVIKTGGWKGCWV